MAEYDLSEITVLAVDDNAFMRKLLGNTLEAIGVGKVEFAVNAHIAFAAMPTAEPDIVLCDLHMESGGGIEFLRLVRRHNDSPNWRVPIVMISGFTEASKVLEARDAGANAFLAKPVSAKTLYDRLVAELRSERAYLRVPSYAGPCRRRRNIGPPDGTPERRANEDFEYILI